MLYGYQRLRAVLQIGTALTFTGHGLVALSGKEKWLEYVQILPIPEAITSHVLMVIGIMDLLVAITILIKPLRYVVLWAFCWALLTALARPLAGEGWLPFVERGANWAAPLALYLLERFKAVPQKHSEYADKKP